jgi:hypothetical protein
MKQHIVQWTAPSPLWSELITKGAAQPAGFGVPSILRFATDDFMQDYLNLLSTDPRRLGEFRAMPETWRGALARPKVPAPARSFALPFQRRGSLLRRKETTGAKALPSADTTGLPRLKLYQPAHQRYYLLSACLVCASAGLPDRRVDAGRQEAIGFVMRRLFPPEGAPANLSAADWDEYAWVTSPNGNFWQKVRVNGRASDALLVPGEERLPLFPTTFQDDDLRARRLVSGIIPVAKREAYLGAQRVVAPPEAPNATTKKTARKILLRKQVIEPWKAIVAQALTVKLSVDEQIPGNDALPDDKKIEARRVSREQVQVLSWLILLDLAEFLKTHIPDLWHAVIDVARPAAAGALRDAYDVLEGATLGSNLRDAIQHNPSSGAGRTQIYSNSAVPGTLRAALVRYRQAPYEINAALKQQLESVEQPYLRADSTMRAAWPSFVFPLADPEFPGEAPLAADLAAIVLDAQEKEDLVQPLPDPLDEFAVALIRALPEEPAGPAPEIPAAAQAPADQLNGVFRIRCVYERPACGPLHDDVVSAPTEPFDLAGFFDPDAPARPIRIGLPLDTSPAGLRKFDKNTAFIMSDMLCGQIKRMKGLTFGDLVRSVLPWPLHKDISVPDGGPCKGSDPNISIGTICSLSIPIITICALILLMIIVTLLDFIFRWLPFFIICFPIPGLKGKK